MNKHLKWIILASLLLFLLINAIFFKFDVGKDVTSGNVYTLNKNSVEFLNEVRDDIDLYLITDRMDKSDVSFKILNEIANASENVKLVPVEKSAFLKDNDYIDLIHEEIKEGSVLVVDRENDRAKYLPYVEMVLTYPDPESPDRNLIEYNVEGSVLSAIESVTKNNLPKVILTTGHGEKKLGKAAKEALEKTNLECKEIKLGKVQTVPSACAVLLVNGPASDFSKKEINAVENYLNAGGNLIVTLAQTDKKLTNFKKLLKKYGINYEKGVVIEDDNTKTLNGLGYILAPAILNAAVTENVIASQKPLALFQSCALSLSSTVRDGIKITPLLKTSSGAYIKKDLTAGTFEKNDSDEPGPFFVGMEVSEEVNGRNAHVIVFGSYSIASEVEMTGEKTLDFASFESIGNLTLFTDSVDAIADKEDISLNIPPRIIPDEKLLFPAGTATLLIFLICVLVPGFVVTAGVVYVYNKKCASRH